MLRSIYDWTLEKARHRHAERWLALVAFAESSVFPVPPDVMLLPMALAERRCAFRYAAIATMASVAGAFAGYAIGAFLWQTVGAPLIQLYGYEAEFARFREGFVDYGAWLVFIFGVTFFPFKVITIASGLVALDPVVFALSALVARGLRFFPEAALLWRFGAPIQRFIERRLALLSTLFVALLLLGFLALKLL
ncbi:MAG: YqaA family protein [Rhodothalassiaceae bacterium]